MNPTLEQKQWENEELFMISALKKDETDHILQSLYVKAKPAEWKFSSEEVTNLSLEERAHEIVREKVFKYFSKVWIVVWFVLMNSKFRLIGRCKRMDGKMGPFAKRFLCQMKRS